VWHAGGMVRCWRAARSGWRRSGDGPVGDVEALAVATASILRDSTLRERLVERGLQRCRQFTWAATAQHTRAVYDALQQRGGYEAVRNPLRLRTDGRGTIIGAEQAR